MGKGSSRVGHIAFVCQKQSKTVIKGGIFLRPIVVTCLEGKLPKRG